jgi:hypothetical protein
MNSQSIDKTSFVRYLYQIQNFCNEKISNRETLMRNQKDKSEFSASQDERRNFLRRCGKATLGLPASALLVSLAGKRARASEHGYGGDEEWGEKSADPLVDTESYNSESGGNGPGGQRRGPVMRSYDRGGVSEIMNGEVGGKGGPE